MKYLLPILILFCSTPASADDQDDCLSKDASMNACEFARALQKSLAPQLPMQMSASMTIDTVSATGRLLTIVGVWHYTKDEVSTMIGEKGETLDDLSKAITAYGKNYACSANIVRSFIDNRGQLQQILRTSDGFVLSVSTVEDCTDAPEKPPAQQ
ncbi:hypothetical protein [Labrys wisconsinensis]|uniref:Uncharacterized protein n=1 Tax=Labrys wisconsinensis TaxID=425677 RepID=A0ABU0JA30_9HYPH|nr:hypothetical protein [Labrys wisconsinensis]MDQ0471112.1 hypothetical protein [Labrys wisconsinensis]